MDHSPTPWSIAPTSEEFGWAVFIVDADEADVIHFVCPRDINDADAAFIVRAANAHEALVEALDRTLSWLTSYPGGGALSPTGPYEQAKAALALARGEQP
jgi:hypothetical protein